MKQDSNNLEETLRLRTAELVVANRLLQESILRRKGVEHASKKSGQHYAKLLKDALQLQENLRQLTHRALSAQEEERREISRELHDVIAQTLAGINVQLAALKKEASVTTRGLDLNIARTQRLVEKSVDLVHRFARDLRPAVLDDLGLIPALHSFMKQFTTRTGVRTYLTAFAKVEQLEIARRTVFFRVAQEALTNVERHAQASRVDVTLRKVPGGVCLKIRDDGKSFRVNRALERKGSKRLGLLGMRERLEMVGGSFTIESAPGKGTTIIAQIPMREERSNGKSANLKASSQLKMMKKTRL
jgi:signal transduction histidine kinase